MNEMASRWRLLALGVAVAAAGVVGFSGATAWAQPAYPLPPAPGLPTPAAAPAAVAGTGAGVTPEVAAIPGTAATVPGAAATPGAVAAPAVPAAAPTIQPASSGTIAEFLKSKGVAMQPQVARDFRALNIVLPMPTGWAQVPDPNVPDAFAVIADRVGGDGLYSSNAQLLVYKLTGDFDPKEAISHGFIDSQILPAWRTTDASLADFNGMPSSLIEGTYRENSMALNTSRRNVIVTAGPDHYLVSLAVTTSVDQAIAAADATDAIATGFKVNVPGATPPAAPAPAPAAAPAPVAAPASPAAPAAPPVQGLGALPQQLGLPR
jgi:Probable lipoprotein LpqN